MGAIATGWLVNGLGQRVAQMNGSVPEFFFVYDEAGHLAGKYDGGGNALWETAWLGDLPVALLTPAGRVFIAPDHLGSPHQITDPTGAVVWLWRPDPFGNGAPTGSFAYELRFPGQYFDSATKLHYNYFRDYDPRLGRYIESDPIGLEGGINTYAYVGGNPVSFVDPLGLTPGTDGAPSRAIGGMVEGIYNYFCSPDVGGNGNGDDPCEKQAQADEAVCRSLPNLTPAQRGIRARCWDSSAARYGACRAGTPLPPLITW